MGSEAKGVLAIWQDLAPEAEAMVNEWYNREHHPERVGVPGFHTARRYVAVQAAPKYFIHYLTDGPEVLGSAPYLERLNNPTPWTREAMPHFRNNNRTVCRIAFRLGVGEGGHVATLRCGPRAGQEDALRTWLRDTALPRALEHPGSVSAELWEADRGTTGLPSAERGLRGGRDEVADWVVVLGANHEPELRAAVAAALAPEALRAAGAADAYDLGTYRLVYALNG